MDSLERLLHASALQIDGVAQDMLREHTRLVLEANKTTNLTRIAEWDEAMRLHVVDSLMCLPEINEAPKGSVVDIGSGAGYPGIPLAIVTGRRVVLLESINKKASFLEAAVRELRLGKVSVLAQRAEEAALLPENRGSYSIVVARAVTSLGSLVELASPFLASGGVLVALKGSPEEAELAAARRTAAHVGMSEASIRRAVLPEGGEQRTFVTYVRTGKPKIRLPRRTGLAQRNPLF